MKKIKKIISFIIFFFLLFDFVNATDIDTFFDGTDALYVVLSDIVMGVIMVVIFWGFVKFMFQNKKDEGKTMMVWGIFGLFIFFSIWAIVGFMQETTVGTGGSIPDPPKIN